MFDVPADATYVWVGAATVSAVALAVVLELPSVTPPDAAAAAQAIDAVAAGPTGSQGTHPLRADRLRLGAHRLDLDGPGGSTHATFAYGPVVPVESGGRLESVLRGTPPSVAFDVPSAFAKSVEAARDRDPSWRPAPDRLVVHRVHWGDVRVTLAG